MNSKNHASKLRAKRNKAEIISYLLENGISTRDEIYNVVEVHGDTARSYIRQLVNEGAVEEYADGLDVIDVPENYFFFIKEELLE